MGRSHLKNGFSFKVKAAVNIRPEEYIGYCEDLIFTPTPRLDEKAFWGWLLMFQIMLSKHFTVIIPFLSDYHHLDASGADNGIQFHHIFQDIKLFLLFVLHVHLPLSKGNKLNN